jgi:hypothetical protein
MLRVATKVKLAGVGNVETVNQSDEFLPVLG